MKLLDILSSDLPEIDESVKECINMGQWLLFRSGTIAGAEGKYHLYLKAGKNFYALSDRGKIMREIEKPRANFGIDELLYFSDLPKPRSLSNSPFIYSSIAARRG